MPGQRPIQKSLAYGPTVPYHEHMTAAPGTRILVLTKPFIDSDETRLTECTVLGEDRLHLIVERKPGSRHYIPRETLIEWAVA